MGEGGLFLRKLRAVVSDRPTGFVWVEKGKLAASGYPASRSQLVWLAGQGIGSILTLTPEPLPGGRVEGLALEVGQIPLADHRSPSLSALEEGAVFIQRERAKGKAVLVHCLAGEGRTGCILAAYLIKDRGVGATEAIRTLRRIKPEFVETGQEGAISEYGSSHSA